MQVYTQDDELIERWQWHDPALRNLSDVVMALLADHPGGRALDLGCGSGRLVARLAQGGFAVDGIDTEERVVALGRRILARDGFLVEGQPQDGTPGAQPGVRLFAGDVFDPQLPTAAGGYDVVVCTEVLEHVGPWQALLARAGELLRPGGTLVVSVPRDPAQFSALDHYAGHLRRFRDHELLDELRPHYDLLATRRLGFPTMRTLVTVYDAMLKLTRRSHAGQSQALWREPGRLKRLVTQLFYRGVQLDNLFAGLPLGTTLVVKARKR